MIVGEKLDFLVAFFNSKLFSRLFRNNFSSLGKNGRELRKVFFEQIKIIEISNDTNDWFKKKVQAIQDNYTIDNAQEIEDYIYRLYELTKQEIDIIESIN